MIKNITTSMAIEDEADYGLDLNITASDMEANANATSEAAETNSSSIYFIVPHTRPDLAICTGIALKSDLQVKTMVALFQTYTKAQILCDQFM